MHLLAALLGCHGSSTAGATAPADSGRPPDTAGSNSCPACDVPLDCSLDWSGQADDDASQQFDLSFTVQSVEGAELQDALGRASFDGDVLMWDARPAGSMGGFAYRPSGLGADGTNSHDGVTACGCTAYGTAHWIIAAEWNDDGGFDGTFTLNYEAFAGDEHCGAAASLAVRATPR
jgi:hypothetical protein